MRLTGTLSSRPVRSTDDVAHVLDWLASPIMEDPAQDLAQLVGELAALERANLEHAHYHRILDLFYERTYRVSKTLKAGIVNAPLPLGIELRATTTLLVNAFERVAAGYEFLLSEASQLAYSKRRHPAQVAAHALHCLAGAQEMCCMMSSPPPADLWRRAHALAKSAQEHYDPDATAVTSVPQDAEMIYKRLLALAASQPEGFSPIDIGLVCDYLSQYSGTVSLQKSPPVQEEFWYWVDVNRDIGPMPPNRRIPADHGELLFCSFQLLARLLGEQISAIDSGMPAGNLRLPDGAAARSGQATLKRLQSHWASPPHRQHSRRHSNFRAQVCIGLTELWYMLEQGEAPDGAQVSNPHITEWMVLNEGPAGYAIMHVSGEVEGLTPGSAIALRQEADQPWSICVVRWMRSENPEHIELGLEMVAPVASSVRLMFRNGDPTQQPTMGLLLPAVPALRDNAAVLAPSGVYTSRRFFIVSGENKTHIMQGRLLSMDLQTGAIELFQFEPDPYPM